MNERRMVEELKAQLAPRCEQVLVHQNLATLSGFKEELVRQFGYLPVLNEVDMICVGRDRTLCAIEVKCFEVKAGSLSRPFYDGIGQSLSLLRYGFDYVALWHLFANDIDQDKLDRYGAATWWFIRNQSGLPLDFTYFRVDDSHQPPQFVVMQYSGPNTGAQLSPIDSSNFIVTWKHPNPFRQFEDAKHLRAALAAALEIAHIVAL